MEYKTCNIKQETENRALRARRALFSSVPCSMFHVPCRRGFSIVETIVAIAILSVAIVAPLTLAQRGLNSSIYAKDQVTAFYLAQEAIEYARNVRDGNNLAGFSQSVSWLSSLELCTADVNPNQKCGIDVNAGQIIDCAAGLNYCQLVFSGGSSGTGIYGDFGTRQNGGALPSPWQSTIFTRTLTIAPVAVSGDANGAADLLAEVSWRTGSIQKSVVINEKIFNWYPAQ